MLVSLKGRAAWVGLEPTRSKPQGPQPAGLGCRASTSASCSVACGEQGRWGMVFLFKTKPVLRPCW